MIRILTYKEIDRGEWSRLVQTSATGTWFQTSKAYEFFASQPELFKPFVVAISNDASLSEAQHSINSSLQTLRAVCVGYVTVERNPIKQYFTRRAIINGGPCFADDCTAEEVELLMNGLKELMSERINGAPIYIETRNFNDYSAWKEAFETAGFSYKPHLNFHVDPSSNNLSDNRKRQLKKSDAVVSEGVSELEIREWYKVLAELYRTKVKTPLWPIEFFLEAYRQGIAKFLLVKHTGRIIGGSMVVADERTLYEWFECGLNAAYKDQYPSVMATYAGIQLAKQSGCTRYDMMGAGEPGVPYGVRDFKAEFGGKLVEHGRFLCVCKPMLYKIGAIVVKILKSYPRRRPLLPIRWKDAPGELKS